MRRTGARILLLAALGYCGLLTPATAQSDALITSIASSSDGQYVASGTNGGAVTCWRVADRRVTWTTLSSGEPILNIFFNRERQAFLIVKSPARVQLLDAKAGTLDLDLVIDLPERDGNLKAAIALSAYDDESEILALSGTIESTIHLVNLRKIPNAAGAQVIALGDFVRWLHPPEYDKSRTSSIVVETKRPSFSEADAGYFFSDDPGAGLAEFALCADGKFALGITRYGWFYRWDATRGGKAAYRRHMEIPYDPDSFHARDFPHTAHVACVNGSLAVTTGTTRKYGGIQIWDIASGTMSSFRQSEPDKGLYDDEYSVAVSSDGRLAVTDGEASYTIWNVSDGMLVRQAKIHHTEPGWEYQRFSFSFASSGHLLALQDAGHVYLADLEGKSIRCLSSADCPALVITDIPADLHR